MVRAVMLAGVLLMSAPVLVPRAQAVGSASQPVRGGMLNLDGRRVAVRGYDVVAYFEEGKPVRGERSHTVRWRGGRFFFASQAHADRFRADPKRFAPAYGGYCAWAVSQGYVADADPEQWAIVDGRLFLNFDADVATKWSAEPERLIQKGDHNWPRVLSR